MTSASGRSAAGSHQRTLACRLVTTAPAAAGREASWRGGKRKRTGLKHGSGQLFSGRGRWTNAETKTDKFVPGLKVVTEELMVGGSSIRSLVRSLGSEPRTASFVSKARAFFPNPLLLPSNSVSGKLVEEL